MNVEQTITWKPTNPHILALVSTFDGNELKVRASGDEFYWAKVSIKVTGRATTRTPLGTYGTKARMTFADDGVTVDCWIKEN